MNNNDFRTYFSPARTSRYLQATSYSTPQAIQLYKANLKLAQSFHPLIGVVEVVLRNSLDNILCNHFNDVNWIINQKSGFMSDASLKFIHKKTGQLLINDFLKNEVIKAEKRLLNAGLPVTNGKVIAEQTLGFWTDLYELHHYKLLYGYPIKIFKHLPAGYGRKQVVVALTKIRKFRNRINHNEPICFKGQQIETSSTEEVYKAIISILNWIDPIFLNFITDIDEVSLKLNEVKKII